MRRRQEDFDELGVQIAVVVFEGRATAETYADEVPWPVLVDPERKLYRAYGMGRGSWRAIWNLATAREYLRLIRRGRTVRRGGGDSRQLGGDVLIDPRGQVRLRHVAEGPTLRPSVDAILSAIAES